ncbi:MAG TPA: glycosyltransferase family 4 protein [Candidatus Eisenbacteria bacterium]|jgi:glycosyltransferase involved in cell wall biosynthesis
MRVLFLTSRFPYPPVGGDRNRVFHFIRALAGAGHEVHLVSFDTAARSRPPEAIAPLESALASLRVVRLPRILSAVRAFAALPGTLPLQAAYYGSARMGARVEEALARVKPDVVYTHLFRMAPYALAAMPRHSAAWILDLTDVISSEIARSLEYRGGFDRWLYRVEGRRIARYEQRVAPLFDRCWVVGGAEAKALAAVSPRARIEVVPLGVDGGTTAGLEEASPIAAGPHASRGYAREPATILFFGFHRIFHNRDAARFLARDIFPLVRARIPDAVLEIAGKSSESLGGAARGEGIRNLGFLADPEQAFARATVFVAPHRFAAGVQTKVLQALDSGAPVVTTPIVREGLEPIPDGILRVGETPEEIAAEIVSLIRNPAVARDLGERGRAWVRSRFTWDHALRAFEDAGGCRRTDVFPLGLDGKRSEPSGETSLLR